MLKQGVESTSTYYIDFQSQVVVNVNKRSFSHLCIMYNN
jgi:hypothetical protein